MAKIAVLSDAPVSRLGDDLRFDRYVKPIVDILTNPDTETPFTVGVFGEWGSGKTSLLNMIDGQLSKDHRDAFVRVQFNPWVHRGEQSMLVPLLHALHDALAEDPQRRFAATVQMLSSVAARLSANVILKHLTADVLSLQSIDEAAARYAQAHGRVESQARVLRKQLEREAKGIGERGARIVFFIDDLDRCQPEEIIDLLESIKLFFDLKNVFIVMAIAKDLVDRGVAARYREFNFDPGRLRLIGDEYLDKMIQLPLYLLPIGDGQLESFMFGLRPPSVLLEQVPLLASLTTPNPRRVKRIINSLAVTCAIMASTEGLRDLRLDLIARLVVLRVQSGDLYSDAVVRPELLVLLEAAYQNSVNLDSVTETVLRTQFSATEPAELRVVARRYFGSLPYLQRLFKASSFRDVRSELRTYLTLLGG